MDNRSEARDFLVTRRARISPAEVGLPDEGQFGVGQARGPGHRVEHPRRDPGDLHDLARAQGPARRRAARRPSRVRPEVQATLDAFTGGPAFVRNGRMEVLAANLLGRAVSAEVFEDLVAPPNLARYVFLKLRAHEFYDDWDRAADYNVAVLRAHAGRDPMTPTWPLWSGSWPPGPRSSGPAGRPTT